MKKSVVIVGMGQLGAALAEGFLKLGRPVVPVLRNGNVTQVCEEHDPEAIVIATGEDDLAPVLQSLPRQCSDRVILIQNELRPDQWVAHEVTDPTVAIVWFEKKKGKLPHVVLPSVLSGPLASLLEECFDKMGLPARTVTTKTEFLHELVLKNLYILGLNLTGMKVGGHAGALLKEHRVEFDKVIDEVLLLEETLSEKTKGFEESPLDLVKLKADLEGAINADPAHGCSGRSAPRRLERTLSHATRAGIETPHIKSLQELNA